MQTAETTPSLALPIAKAMQATGLGRNSIYDEINSGRLRSFRVGRRRLVSEEAIREWIRDREAESLQGAQA